MKRITTNDDIRFPIRVVKGLDSDIFTIQFYTTSKAVNITKTNEDVVDGIIHLEWTELYPLGTGVMNYTVLIPEADGSYSDDTFNRSISGTTIFYIVSNIIVPDGDDAQNLIDLVAELDTKLDAEIARSTGKDSEHEASLAEKANKNGSSSEAFNTLTLNLRREGANTSLYNYNINGEEYVSFYDQTGGSLTYHFTPNQGDNIATERQLAEKANISDVYTKEQADLLINSSEGLLEEPTEKIPKYSTAHPIRILGIGNSYMTEGTRELEGFLTAEGLTEDELDLEIAYYPARTLEAWFEAIRDGGGYEQLVQFKYNSGNHKWYRTAEHNVANIRDTISGKAWDLIVLQEFPSFSSSNPHASEYYSYYETLSSVITLCKSLCSNSQVQFGWHMIWSNDQYIANNYMVWQNICDASKRTAKLSDVSFIIPSATALQNAYNTSYFRGYEHHFLLMDQIGHPAAGAARYIIGATWFESLIAPIFGRSLIGNGYVPSFISDGTVTYQDAEVEVNSGNVLLAKLCAISSILDKYDVNHELEKKLNLYYTKTQTDALLDSKADRNGSSQYTFAVKKLGLQNEGAAMVLYNYVFDNHDVFEIYDNEGGTLQYVFSGNNDKIATERQLALKANSTDVYSKGEVDTALSGKANTGDVYTKGEVDTKLAGKANTNGSNSQSFTANAFNLQKDGASTTLYNYKDTNNREFVSFYDQTGGSLTYQFTANQADKIATERQLALKANSADVYNKSEVYTKSETYTKGEVNNLIPELPDNIVTDASYVHTDNNFTTTLKNKLDGIASGAEVNVQANWNETNSSSDAYILNKPTIPTIDSSITGSSQTNAVQGGAIYTALQGKAGYKYYGSKSDMEDDTSVPNGTIGFDSNEEKFYIYDSGNAEWRPIDHIDQTNTDTQLTYLTLTRASSTTTLTNDDGTVITPEEYTTLLDDHTKDIVLYYSGNMYSCSKRYTDEIEEGYVESSYISFNNIGNGIIKKFSLDLEKIDDEPWSYYFSDDDDDSVYNTFYINGINNTTQSVSYYLAGWALRYGNILVVNFQKDVKASTTLNITSTGAKYIYYRGAVIKNGIISAGDTVTLAYCRTRYNVISIEKYHSTDIAAVSSNIGSASTATITKTIPSYSTWKVTASSGPSYSTWTTKLVLNTVGSNTAPIHTIIIDPSILDSVSYTGDIIFSNASSLRWKDNDEPDLTYQGWHGINYMVITIYEGIYAKYEQW